MAVICSKFYMYVSSGILSFVVSQSDSLFYFLSGSPFCIFAWIADVHVHNSKHCRFVRYVQMYVRLCTFI